MTNKPNIVFFFTDDQRFDTIAALGNKEIKTPHIDALVKDGTSFTHAHIPGGSHGAVCMPSRGMLHTGRTLYHLDNHGCHIPREHSLMGETLRNNGYVTFGTGKWHNGKDSFARSFSDGDEIFFGGMSDHWNVPAYHYDPTGNYHQTKFIKDPMLTNDVVLRDCDHIHAGKHSSELFCEATTKWLRNYTSDNPFFMYISFMAPHDPRSMPEEFQNMYNPDDIHLPVNFSKEHFDYGISDIRDELLAPNPRTEENITKHIAEYYGMISHLDNELGKVITTLKEKGLYDNTIIIFAGDNGLAIGQHGLMGKQSCYEHSIRVPLIFSGPMIPKNQKQSSYAYLLDIFPTLCDMINIPIPSSVEGKSLLPAMNDNVVIREDLYFSYGSFCRGVKNDRYKLIEYRNATTSETQLFDLINDPYEMNNLANDKSFENIQSALTKKLLDYRDSWDDESQPTGKEFWSYYQRSNA